MQAHYHARIRILIRRGILTAIALKHIRACSANEQVIPTITFQPVVTATSFQAICNGVSDNLVIPVTGYEILDQGIPRDNQVADQAVHIRNSFRTQVNPLVSAVCTGGPGCHYHRCHTVLTWPARMFVSQIQGSAGVPEFST